MVSTKPYPGGRNVHAFIEAALAIRSETGANDVQRVILRQRTGPAPSATRDFPIDYRGTYSMPYSVALALATGEAPISAFVDPTTITEAVRELFERVSFGELESAAARPVLEVVYASGRVIAREVGVARGHPGNPLSRDELLAKFWACHQYANSPISAAAATEVIEVIDDLPRLESTSRLTSLLART
jgi:2-methylcitrate dehydratase PrpD